MPSRTRRFRPFLALLLALTMVPTGAADAAVTTSSTDAPVAAAAAVTRTTVPDTTARVVVNDRAVDPVDDDADTAPAPSVTTTTVTRAVVETPVPAAKHASIGSSKAPKAGSSKPHAATRHGRNHVWIPALGISRSTTFSSCSSSAFPGNRVYRWGCAGRNNVYLFAHASSVFRPLHDAYVRGRLHKGMTLYYANAAGAVSTYKVIWWRLTSPTKGDFAFASLSRPSLTLQTCIGARSQWRLIVRLVKV